MLGYNSGYCDSLELESQNIADITMSQLSQLTPVYEVSSSPGSPHKHQLRETLLALQGDILSSALYQTILGEDSSSSSYSANSPYSPDSASPNGEPLASLHESNTDLGFRAGGSPVSSGVQDGERGGDVSSVLILLPALPRQSVSRHQALLWLQHDVSFLQPRPHLSQCSQAGQ